MKKHTTVLFDFDGTLLYTVKDLADAVNVALEQYGYPTHSVETIQGFVGNGVAVLMARAIPGGTENPDYAGALARFKAFYALHSMDNTAPYAGIQEMLHGLKAQGRKMAIVTNKYQAAAEDLRRQFFDDTVPLIVGDLEGRERKPAPDAVYVAMEQLGAEKADCVYVGDTEVDMQTAQNAGIDFAACAWGYRTRQQLEALGIPLIADTPADLIGLI
ncbi:MAG: HAD family hydrolase [Oscillospiraceae bacterium]